MHKEQKECAVRSVSVPFPFRYGVDRLATYCCELRVRNCVEIVDDALVGRVALFDADAVAVKSATASSTELPSCCDALVLGNGERKRW